MKEFEPDKGRMKTEVGNYLTQSLFYEVSNIDGWAQYTIKPYDYTDKNGNFYPSLRRLYMETADPTEYEFAVKYLYDWEHWQRICHNQFLSDNLRIQEWRDELVIKLRSDAAKTIFKQSLNNFNAAKWVSEGGWEPKKRGRVSKEEKQRRAAIEKRIAQEVQEDGARVLSALTKQHGEKLGG